MSAHKNKTEEINEFIKSIKYTYRQKADRIWTRNFCVLSLIILFSGNIYYNRDFITNLVLLAILLLVCLYGVHYKDISLFEAIRINKKLKTFDGAIKGEYDDVYDFKKRALEFFEGET